MADGCRLVPDPRRRRAPPHQSRLVPRVWLAVVVTSMVASLLGGCGTLWLEEPRYSPVPVDERRVAPAPRLEPRPRTRFIHGQPVDDEFGWLRALPAARADELLAAEDAHAREWFLDHLALLVELQACLPAPPDGEPARRSLPAPGDDRRVAVVVPGSRCGTNHLELEDRARRLRYVLSSVPVGSVTWAPDGDVLFYVQGEESPREPGQGEHQQPGAAIGRPHRLVRQHLGSEALGEPVSAPRIVFREPDERFSLAVRPARSGRLLFLEVSGPDTSEVWFLDSSSPRAAIRDEFRLLVPRREGRRVHAVHQGELFYLLVHEPGGPGRIVSCPVADPRPESWREVLPAREDVTLEGLIAFREFLLVRDRRTGRDAVIGEPGLQVLATGRGPRHPGLDIHRVGFPAAQFQLGIAADQPFDGDRFVLTYQTWTNPPADYEYRVAQRRLVPRPSAGHASHRETARLDPLAYRTWHLRAPTRDGVEVPVTILHHAESPVGAGAGRPLVLLVGGSHGESIPATYDLQLIELLERGVVVALVHARGGGELGRSWHEAGRQVGKGHSVEDVLDVASHLVADGWTSPRHLAGWGRSPEDGLLLLAAMHRRPELFRALVVHDPLVAPVLGMLDGASWATPRARAEWGDPRVRSRFDTLLRIDPTLTIPRGDLPALLVTAGACLDESLRRDLQVYIARLRHRRAADDPDPILLRIDPATASDITFLLAHVLGS